MEDFKLDKNGRTLNTGFWDYKILPAEDMPPFQYTEIHTFEVEGPFGAKETGEGLAIPLHCQDFAAGKRARSCRDYSSLIICIH